MATWKEKMMIKWQVEHRNDLIKKQNNNNFGALLKQVFDKHVMAGTKGCLRFSNFMIQQYPHASFKIEPSTTSWRQLCRTTKKQAISIRINSVWITNLYTLLEIHCGTNVSIIDCMVSVVIMMSDIPRNVRRFSPKPAAASLYLAFRLGTKSAFLSTRQQNKCV